jgi:hypothetical protein
VPSGAADTHFVALVVVFQHHRGFVVIGAAPSHQSGLHTRVLGQSLRPLGA